MFFLPIQQIKDVGSGKGGGVGFMVNNINAQIEGADLPEWYFQVCAAMVLVE